MSSAERPIRGVWFELDAILEGEEDQPFSGQIVLHCDKGEVQKYAVTEIRRPQLGSLGATTVQEGGSG